MKKFENLRDLDDGCRGDDGEAESFGDCERQTFGVCRDVKVEKEGAVTLGPKESNEGIVERRREIGGNWGEVRF